MTFNWSKMPFILGTLYGLVLTILSFYFEKQVAIPWSPVSVIGIAVAFYLGFKNNSSYDRTWEARKIWGSIVNNSRSFSAATISFVQGSESESIHKELIYRHIAWITALRFQLRLSKPWEHLENRLNGLYTPTVCEQYIHMLEEDLTKYISQKEIDGVKSNTNIATQIMVNQSKRLQELKDQGYFETFRHMELQGFITSFYEDQGKSERIKNFPFPRQYASTALWFTWVFAFLLPFGILDILKGEHDFVFWFSPLLTGLIIWVFFLMEKIGDYSENPFEGTYNDVPITTIAKSIEIDLREMISDTNIPPPEKERDGFQM